VVRNGDVVSEPGERCSSKGFLAGRSRGAYTTARTVSGGNAVLEFGSHVSRTASTLRTILEQTTPPAVQVEREPVADEHRVRPRLMEAMIVSVRELQRQRGDRVTEGEDYRLTVLAHWTHADLFVRQEEEIKALEIWCHATVLPPPPPSPVVVEVRGSVRGPLTTPTLLSWYCLA
jgi:hypothetical protein